MKNNLEEYNDPTLYDLENESYKEDIPFLLKFASRIDGPIIDLACGTGRATIPLAEENHQLIGIDLHRGMLNEARRKASELQLSIDWILQDCTKLKLPMKSKLIYSVGNSFQHFLSNEEQDGLLFSVYQHLETDGIFIFNTRFPSEEELLQPSTEEYWRTYEDLETLCKVDVYTISSYDSLLQVQDYTTIRRFKNENEEVINESRTNISLRYVFPKEMERVLSSNGFEIVKVYEDWNETPLTSESTRMIYVCKKIAK
ncbi:class I SAM-dependent methyltransferase [Bacillus luteolus]|uniref:Class I SAM-dependent methyltransferase n=1 Tax=Litchfieldia luteola TaxID=682179 RepID=A0ABR9QG79_9BACI|nr:class I SAM-dependent methyltransferase [Cytobacillus luteolus]MBE4907500.1 class I SAM-dependent methyltransferase [Cytobacillus luteolus]MBP1944268.1 ubiquinone/menaquinone biosynthesis C-methylase UbiE [Cytobacillus luteolus]